MALSPASERAQADSSPLGSVLDAVRLRRRVLRAALDGAYLLEDRAATRSFASLGPAGGPRLRVGTKRIRDSRLEVQREPGGCLASEHARSRRPRRALSRQAAHARRRRSCSARAMASGGSTGHRCRNLWPDRQECPGNPGGSGHRSRSRDCEKSLLRRSYARLLPCSMVRKGSTVRVRQRALRNRL